MSITAEYCIIINIIIVCEYCSALEGAIVWHAVVLDLIIKEDFLTIISYYKQWKKSVSDIIFISSHITVYLVFVSEVQFCLC